MNRIAVAGVILATCSVAEAADHPTFTGRLSLQHLRKHAHAGDTRFCVQGVKVSLITATVTWSRRSSLGFLIGLRREGSARH